jgi:hypothetical protein
MITKANSEVPNMDGHALYDLKLDAASVRATMAAASGQDVVRTFVKLATQADLDDEEIEALRNEATAFDAATAVTAMDSKQTIAKNCASYLVLCFDAATA